MNYEIRDFTGTFLYIYAYPHLLLINNDLFLKLHSKFYKLFQKNPIKSPELGSKPYAIGNYVDFPGSKRCYG